MKLDEQEYIGSCLSGDYYQIITYLNSLKDVETTKLLEIYKDIFENGKYIIDAEDDKIIGFLHDYEDYLKWVLTHKITPEECKTYFLNKFKKYFSKIHTWEEMDNAVTTYFKEKGYFITFGVTRPFVDMYLWKKQTNQKYLIELPEETLEINVYEMDETITRGWIDYISLNKVSAGGWATSEGIYYFKKSYDVTSDNFQISLLKHEAQHAFDLKRYPNMQSSDLEYRAKLVELIYHSDINYFLTFLASIGDDRNNYPHQYASKKVVQGLSKKIFEKELELNPDLWIKENKKIVVFSRELLKEHNERLINWNGQTFIV